jgi:hypothetical protein
MLNDGQRNDHGDITSVQLLMFQSIVQSIQVILGQYPAMALFLPVLVKQRLSTDNLSLTKKK